MEDDSINLIVSIGDIIINGSPKDRRVSSVNKQYHLDDFVYRMITDFEVRAPRLSDSGRRCRARSKHKSAWCFKVIFNRESWVSIRTNGIVVKERHPLNTLLAAQ